MILGKCKQISVGGLGGIENRGEAARIDGAGPVQNEAAAQRIRVRNVVIDGCHSELVILERGRSYWDQSDRYGYTGRAGSVGCLISRANNGLGGVAAGRGRRCSRCGTYILLQDVQIVLVDAGEARQRRVARGGGSADRSRRTDGSYWVVLVVDKKE